MDKCNGHCNIANKCASIPSPWLEYIVSLCRRINNKLIDHGINEKHSQLDAFLLSILDKKLKKNNKCMKNYETLDTDNEKEAFCCSTVLLFDSEFTILHDESSPKE